MSAITTLHKAKELKNDEFYTQLADVSNELMHYKTHFKNKTVLCNCNDSVWSAFWKYFHLNFAELGLKKLISTSYSKGEIAYKMEYTGGDDNDIEVCVKTPLEGNGDFRNLECLDLLDECDIVVTNPAFSLFRPYMTTLMEHQKKFIVWANNNAITYKEFFPLLKDNKVWLGYTANKTLSFRIPDDYEKWDKIETAKINDGHHYAKVPAISVFTNLDIAKRHEKLILREQYTPERYPKYSNYDAINVNKVSDIPNDYDGVMGVPITFLCNFNPDQFEILGYAGGVSWDNFNTIKTLKEYIGCKQHDFDGTISNGSKINTGAALCFDTVPADRYYTASNCNGYLVRTYGRILIQKRNV